MAKVKLFFVLISLMTLLISGCAEEKSLLFINKPIDLCPQNAYCPHFGQEGIVYINFSGVNETLVMAVQT